MTRLVMERKPLEHLYQKNTAMVFIAYDSKTEPKDHKGIVMGEFYQEPFTYQAHLEKAVVPKLQIPLNKLGYQIKEVDILQGWPPFLSVSRNDGGAIDYEDLNQSFEKLIAAGNKARNTKHTLVSHSIFKTVSETKQREDEEEYIYVPRMES